MRGEGAARNGILTASKLMSKHAPAAEPMFLYTVSQIRGLVQAASHREHEAG